MINEAKEDNGDQFSSAHIFQRDETYKIPQLQYNLLPRTQGISSKTTPFNNRDHPHLFFSTFSVINTKRILILDYNVKISRMNGIDKEYGKISYILFFTSFITSC